MLVVSDRERRPKDQAVDAAIEQAADLPEPLVVVLLEVGHLLAIADPDGDRQVIGPGQRHVDARQHVDPERIVRRDHHADHLGAAGLHAVDEQVAPPAELAGRHRERAGRFPRRNVPARRAEFGEAALSETLAALATSFKRGADEPDMDVAIPRAATGAEAILAMIHQIGGGDNSTGGKFAARIGAQLLELSEVRLLK